MHNIHKVVRWVSLLMVAIFVVKGCRPTDVSLLEEEKTLKRRGNILRRKKNILRLPRLEMQRQ